MKKIVSDFKLVQLGDIVRCMCTCGSIGEVMALQSNSVTIKTETGSSIIIPSKFVEIVESSSASDEELWE